MVVHKHDTYRHVQLMHARASSMWVVCSYAYHNVLAILSVSSIAFGESFSYTFCHRKTVLYAEHCHFTLILPPTTHFFLSRTSSGSISSHIPYIRSLLIFLPFFFFFLSFQKYIVHSNEIWNDCCKSFLHMSRNITNCIWPTYVTLPGIYREHTRAQRSPSGAASLVDSNNRVVHVFPLLLL